MARKNKSTKDSNEHSNATTATTTPKATPTTPTPETVVATTTTLLPQEKCLAEVPPALAKRENTDENVLLLLQQQQQQQQQQHKKQAQSAEHKGQQQHQSDGELMELKQKLNLEKNKSNLFLIKSYSFNDKTNLKRPQDLNKQNKLKQFDKFQSIMFSNGSISLQKDAKDNINEMEKDKTIEERQKQAKLKKMKKTKSTPDATEDMQQLQAVLRKPSIVLEANPPTENGKRPQSMPQSMQSSHKNSLTKSKTLDDIETPRLKRDSFIRHSLQSIRRSFSSSKKQQNNCNSNYSTSSSSCSNSSSNGSDSLKKNKTKDSVKDVGNLKDVEESSFLLAEEGEEEDEDGDKQAGSFSRPCSIVVKLNDAQALGEYQQQQQQQKHKEHQQQYSMENSTIRGTPSSLYTIDSLAVLKEEDEKDLNSCVNIVSSRNNNNNNNNSPPCVITEQRSTSSVSTLAQLPSSPMAPLQTHAEYQSVQCLNILDKDYTDTIIGTSSSSPPQKVKRAFQHQLSIPESLQSTSIGCATSSEYSSARSLKHSAASLTPLPALNSSGSLRSISPSHRSASSNSSSTAKHEQSTAAATAAAAATATTSNGSLSTTPPEKEKKRKEISSSRVKKFHRHFSQVSKDEKLINYFSCALVSDILLQGHLYITDQHFAFYSNVFGYVTKVVIPTSSVTKISKEKTAKIIPNAVGVATADERHVFGSFISREAAFRLMCSVCPPLGVSEILPKDPASIEICEEYSIEDDSSCSISGNESPAQAIEVQNSNTNGKRVHNDTSQTLLRRSVASSNLSIAETAANKTRHSEITNCAKTSTNATSIKSSTSSAAVLQVQYVNGGSAGGGGSGSGDGSATEGSINLLGLKTALQPSTPPTPANESEAKLSLVAGCTSTSSTSTPTPSTSSSPTTVMTVPSSKVKRIMNILSSVSKSLMVRIKYPTEIHVVYLGVLLTLLLALFTIFLLYRILDIEAKTNVYRTPVEFNWRSGNDDEIFSEALRFQRELQLKSTEEAQQILKTNLEQIAKVRRSLETLSMLIHDRSSSFPSSNTDDSD